MFAPFGVDMWYDGKICRGHIDAIPCETELCYEDEVEMKNTVMRK